MSGLLEILSSLLSADSHDVALATESWESIDLTAAMSGMTQLYEGNLWEAVSSNPTSEDLCPNLEYRKYIM